MILTCGVEGWGGGGTPLLHLDRASGQKPATYNSEDWPVQEFRNICLKTGLKKQRHAYACDSIAKISLSFSSHPHSGLIIWRVLLNEQT